jgi:hypothetical protein
VLVGLLNKLVARVNTPTPATAANDDDDDDDDNDVAVMTTEPRRRQRRRVHSRHHSAAGNADAIASDVSTSHDDALYVPQLMALVTELDGNADDDDEVLAYLVLTAMSRLLSSLINGVRVRASLSPRDLQSVIALLSLTSTTPPIATSLRVRRRAVQALADAALDGGE